MHCHGALFGPPFLHTGFLSARKDDAAALQKGITLYSGCHLEGHPESFSCSLGQLFPWLPCTFPIVLCSVLCCSLSCCVYACWFVLAGFCGAAHSCVSAACCLACVLCACVRARWQRGVASVSLVLLLGGLVVPRLSLGGGESCKKTQPCVLCARQERHVERSSAFACAGRAVCRRCVLAAVATECITYSRQPLPRRFAHLGKSLSSALGNAVPLSCEAGRRCYVTSCGDAAAPGPPLVFHPFLFASLRGFWCVCSLVCVRWGIGQDAG